ncbi:MAG: universal stress protein [Wenzhouxiangella sp.]|nr:universal stress protein [Wenzhouxiangella sp.]MCH8479343.1 universal stress protein [Wenzhouxiangella sp.]TVR97421.1 MAG: universal stress protein [Wenzhouxiangellaceae bacterium]
MKKILVGVDGSAQAEKAFEHALTLARWSGAQLAAVAVIHGPDIEMSEPPERERLVAAAHEKLSQVLDRFKQRAAEDDVALDTHLLNGHPVEQILELAWQGNVDHLVLGHRSKGLFERLLMGSVAKRVVDFARCTVTVVR